MKFNKSYDFDLTTERPRVQGIPSVSFNVCGKVLNAKVICVEKKPNFLTISLEIDKNCDSEALKVLHAIAKAHQREGTNHSTFVMPNCKTHPDCDTVLRVNVDRIKQWELTLAQEVINHFNISFQEKKVNKDFEHLDLDVPDYS